MNDVNTGPDGKKRKLTSGNQPNGQDVKPEGSETEEMDVDTACSSNWEFINIQLEGKLRIKTYHIKHKKMDLNQLAQDLCSKLTPLIRDNITPDDLVFVRSNERLIELEHNTLLIHVKTSYKDPLIIRYPFSDSKILVKLNPFGKPASYDHNSGLWYLVREKAEELIVEKWGISTSKFCFSYKDEDESEEEEIEHEICLNSLVSRIVPDEENKQEIHLTVKLKDRKLYSDLDIKDAMQLFGKSSIADCKSFKLDASQSLSKPEEDSFVSELKREKFSFKVAEVNEATSREFISPFLTSAVTHVGKKLQATDIRLMKEVEIIGNKGYGVVDYLISFNDVILPVTKPKGERMAQGAAQTLVQMYTAYEDRVKKEPAKDFSKISNYGVVTTGIIWRFLKWSRGIDKPDLQMFDVSWSFDDPEMEGPLKVLSYLISLLTMYVSSLQKVE